MPFFRKKRTLQRGCSHETSHSSLKVLAAQTLKIASINGLGDTEKLETELEDEIRWEERHPPREIIGRLRKRCDDVLHSKQALLTVVILNIIDCLLVVVQLTLDFHQVTNQFVSLTHHNDEFFSRLKHLYPSHLQGLHDVSEDNVTVLFNYVLQGYIFWNSSDYTGSDMAEDCLTVLDKYNASGTSPQDSSNALLSLLKFNEAGAPDTMETMDHEHLHFEKVAHMLHYSSISILSCLLAETLLKISCVGERFLKKRMEMFDAAVIAISFILDIVFIKGLTSHNLENFVVILSFLLPWRVLRVLNSLIVALMDQHRFHLKILYKQKRKINRQYHDASEKIKFLEQQMDALKKFCQDKGIKDWEVNKALAHTIKPSAQGGLKALGTLIFKAAESLAPITSTRNSLASDLTAERPKSSSVNDRCNGDVERSSSNGHVHSIEEEIHVEDETIALAECKNSNFSAPQNSAGDSPAHQCNGDALSKSPNDSMQTVEEHVPVEVEGKVRSSDGPVETSVENVHVDIEASPPESGTTSQTEEVCAGDSDVPKGDSEKDQKVNWEDDSLSNTTSTEQRDPNIPTQGDTSRTSSSEEKKLSEEEDTSAPHPVFYLPTSCSTDELEDTEVPVKTIPKGVHVSTIQLSATSDAENPVQVVQADVEAPPEVGFVNTNAHTDKTDSAPGTSEDTTHTRL